MTINNIWIVNSNGIPLYTKMSKKVKKDPILVSGFIYAISAFAKSIIGDEVKSIKLKKHTFYVKKHGEIIVAILSDLNEEEKIERILSKIAEEFLDTTEYEKETNAFNVDDLKVIDKKIGEILNQI